MDKKYYWIIGAVVVIIAVAVWYYMKKNPKATASEKAGSPQPKTDQRPTRSLPKVVQGADIDKSTQSIDKYGSIVESINSK